VRLRLQGVRIASLPFARLSHGSGDRRVDFVAPADGTYEPLSPIGHACHSAITSSVLGRFGFDLMAARLAHTIRRTLAEAALPSVISGPGFDSTRGDAFLDAARAPDRVPRASVVVPAAVGTELPATLFECCATFSCGDSG
jgi:hypothetical protein